MGTVTCRCGQPLEIAEGTDATPLRCPVCGRETDGANPPPETGTPTAPSVYLAKPVRGRRVATAFYVSSLVAVLVILLILQVCYSLERVLPWSIIRWQMRLSFFLCMPARIYGFVVLLILFRKLWRIIEDGPGTVRLRAVVCPMLIPFWNLFWAFQVFHGFAQDFNAFVRRRRLSVRPLSEGLFRSYSIMLAVALGALLVEVWFRSELFSPEIRHILGHGPLGMAVYLAELVLAVCVAKEGCRAVNELHTPEIWPATEDAGPQPFEKAPAS